MTTTSFADPESVGGGGDGDEREDEDAGDESEGDESEGDESGDEQEGDEEEDSEEGDEDAGDEEERDEEEDEDSGDEDAGDEEEENYEDECEDDPRWRKHPRKRRGKRYDCDWVAAKARKRCKKKNKIGVRASEACECACA